MINKRIAYLIVFVLFVLSAVTTYSFFSTENGQSFLSPISYQAPKSENGINETAAANEPKTEECPLNGEILSKTQKNVWEGKVPPGQNRPIKCVRRAAQTNCKPARGG